MADYIYIGGKWGGFIPGIPARDLSDKEIKDRGIDTKILDNSPLYKKLAKRRKKKE